MAINGGSIGGSSSPALSASTSAVVCPVPPGVGTVIVSNTSGVTVYLAAGVAATATNGFAIPTGAPPVEIPMYPGSKGTTFNVLAGSGSITGSVSWLVSTAQ